MKLKRKIIVLLIALFCSDDVASQCLSILELSNLINEERVDKLNRLDSKGFHQLNETKATNFVEFKSNLDQSRMYIDNLNGMVTSEIVIYLTDSCFSKIFDFLKDNVNWVQMKNESSEYMEFEMKKCSYKVFIFKNPKESEWNKLIFTKGILKFTFNDSR